MTLQRRFIDQKRAAVKLHRGGDDGAFITGYAAVFFNASDPGTEYELWDDWYERIAPGAFDRAIRENHDARGLFNHDPSLLLGRTVAGTARLSVDEIGLKYEIDMPDTQCGRDVCTSIERGDLSGSSFAFIPKRTVWIEEDNRTIREIQDVDLFDIGPVTYPAYEATTTGLRTADRKEIEQELARWQSEHRSDAEAVAVRLRTINVLTS